MQRWHFRPRGLKRYRVYMWVKLPISNTILSQDIRPSGSCTVKDLMPCITTGMDEIMDQLRNELFEHWATFLLSVGDSTTDEEIDNFHDNFPASDYGLECYVWG